MGKTKKTVASLHTNTFVILILNINFLSGGEYVHDYQGVSNCWTGLLDWTIGLP